MMSKALVLLSGGMDSAVCLYEALSARDTISKVHTLTFHYQQANVYAELGAVRRLQQEVLKEKGIKIESLVVPLFVPMHRVSAKSFLVQGRNGIMLAYAFAEAAQRGFDYIFGGWTKEDYMNYPDCRIGYLTAAAKAFNLGLGRENNPILVLAPLIGRTKQEVIRLGDYLGVPWEHTVSCYVQKEFEDPPCGECDACQSRTLGFSGRGL